MTDTPKALSAEEEAVQRFLSAAKKTTRWNLMADDHSLVAFYSHTQHDKTGASPNDIARALDAARAEAEAVRALAAELVEGLNIARRRFELLAVYDDTPRNGVRPSVGAAEAETLIAKARAAGIGAPAPKGERLEITVETPAETARSYDGIRRALGLEPAPKGEKGEPNG